MTDERTSDEFEELDAAAAENEEEPAIAEEAADQQQAAPAQASAMQPPNEHPPEPSRSPPQSPPAAKAKSVSPAEYGIPADIVELLGPIPSETEQGRRRFFGLLQAFAAEHPPLGLSDWADLWDRAEARLTLARALQARNSVIPLYKGRACKEIARPASRRFVPAEAPSGADNTQRNLDEAEVGEEVEDRKKALKVLAELDLQPNAVDAVAYALAQPVLAPLEAVAQAKRHQDRTCEEALERRKARRSAPRGRVVPVQDAEFEAVTPALAPTASTQVEGDSDGR